MYAVVDLETTGGSAQYGKITEVAIYVFDGEKIVDEFTSLINPECPIPANITRLTGISNEMVADAPRFFEVAKEIVQFTEGHIFVAHNVNFDYKFLQEEFRRLGYAFRRETLCTVRLARRSVPGQPSYSLGKLTKSLGISLTNHHRAAADARATVDLLKYCLDAPSGEKAKTALMNGQKSGKAARKLLPPETIEQLPDATGVYYLHDAKGDVLYVGKSVNIRQRIFQHLNERKGRAGHDLREFWRDVSWEETGSELVALLQESHDIKRLQPPFNIKQRRNAYPYGLFQDIELDGYIRLSFGPNKGKEPLAVFASEGAAKKVLERMTERYNLCQKMNGLDPYRKEAGKPCWHYSLQQCKGACVGEEGPEEYNKRVVESVRSLQYGVDDFLIIDAGRHADERAVVRIAQGRYAGFGFADLEAVQGDLELLKDCTSTYADNREVVRIIKGYLKTHRVEQIIPLSV